MVRQLAVPTLTSRNEYLPSVFSEAWDADGSAEANAVSLLEDARNVLSEDPVCASCVGRVFADRSHGLTNEERGKALRVAVAMADDVPYEPVPAETCWVCEGESGTFGEWADRVVEALSGTEFETYQVGTRTPPLLEENELLLRESAGVPVETGEPFKSECNREVGKRVGERTGTVVDFDRSDVLALLNLERGDVDVQINPAFIYGRYRKLERDVPQTEWPCRECGASGKQLAEGGGEEPCDHCGGSGYLYDVSVEGSTVPPVVEAMEGSEGIFHGAGREDVDALMLGTGRPFVIEVKRPRRRTPDVEALEREINEYAGGTVEVDDLRLATYEMVERVKELPASKVYRMDVEFAEPVSADELDAALEELDDATVEQRTPRRVDHRRADLVRTRRVYAADGRILEERRGEVEIHGEGGLYVKELVSGDDGRTEPSLAGLLGVESTVTALDVLAVEGEDEPFDDPAYLQESSA